MDFRIIGIKLAAVEDCYYAAFRVALSQYRYAAFVDSVFPNNAVVVMITVC